MNARIRNILSFITMCIVSSSTFLPIGMFPAPVYPRTKGSCTSFFIDNNGQGVFGANYDNTNLDGQVFVNKRGVVKSGYEAGTSGKYARWASKYASITFNLVGVQMPWAGMNEAGLMISTMFLEQTRNPSPDERPPLVSPLWIQYMLDTSTTIAEVIANDARVRIKDTVDHYLVCDQTGTCASVEFLQGKTVFHTGKSMPVKALANQVYEKQAKGWLSDKLPDKDRFHLAVDRIGAFQPTDTASAVTYAFDTLEQLSGQVLHGTPTQWSIVFNPSDLRVYFRTSRNPQIRSLDFSELDLGCETPVQMLDIHAPLEGDISHKLERFSFDANLRQTLNFLNQWGANVMPEWKVEVLERGVTSFPCKQPSTPYQAEIKPLIPPVVGWAALALLYRFWWVGILVGLCLTTLVAWQIKVHGTKR